MKKQLQWCLGQARQSLAKHPQYDHYLHWSFILQNTRVVEWGMNRDHQPAIQWGYRAISKIHSELDAYKKARPLLSEGPFVVANIRLSRQGQLKMSMPCPPCTRWLREMGCYKVWFTTPEGWATMCL